MENTAKEINLPFVARHYWFIRWGLLLTNVFIWVGLIANYSETINSLYEAGLIISIIFLIGICIFPVYAIFVTFFSKTVFDERSLEHTNQLLIKKSWLYEDVEKVETAHTGGHIRITFLDGQAIKISRGEADLNYLLSFLRTKLPHLRR